MKHISHLLIATTCVVLSVTAFAQSPVLLQTFNNPAPASGNVFGRSLAALGNDRVLVAAPYGDLSATNDGVVYLFHTNGTLLKTFTNPNPAINPYLGNDRFGAAVAAVGADHVLIGAPNEARAYLFSTNGALVTTIESPHLTNYPFGSVVAAFGNDRVLIGTPEYDSEDNAEGGVAHLYSTNGTLLAILDNPDPQFYGLFGASLAALGSDRVLVGAPGRGQIYLFTTNGTLLTSFTNPIPAAFDYLGDSVAAVGTDRVLCSSIFGSTIPPESGKSFLLSTNGGLLTTITNPNPSANDLFGNRVGTLGNDRLIISAPGDDTTGTNAGAAYVFSVNGTLLATLNNPTPAPNDYFGFQLATFGSESALISAAGAVYLFRIPASPSPPSLRILRTATNAVVVSWPSAAIDFTLQQNTNGVSSMNWSNVTSTIQDDGTDKVLIVNPTGASRFYRLYRP